MDHGLLQLLLQPLDFCPEPESDFRVEGAQGLIQKEHLGIRGEGPDEGDPLLLPTAQLGRVKASPVGQTDQVEHSIHPFRNGLLRHLPHLQTEGDVLLHGHVREKGVGLKNDPEFPFLGDKIVDHAVVEDHLPFRDRFKSGDHPEYRGFSATAGPKKANELTFPDLQIDMIHGGKVPVALREIFQPEVSSHWPSSLRC